MFVRDDASKPPLSPLYRGPYLVLRRSEKFFVLQIGDKKDAVSVDRLKPVFSSSPVVPGLPPVRGRPRLVPASVPGPPAVGPPVKKFTFSPIKKVRFSPVPATQLRRNPHRSARGSPPLSAVLRPHLLGGVTVAPPQVGRRPSLSTALSPWGTPCKTWRPAVHDRKPSLAET